MTVPEAFQLALQRHQAGRLADAEALYRQILAAQPSHAEALHHLGLLALQAGHPEIAVPLVQQAAVLDPGNPATHSDLGEACRVAGRLDEALAAHRRALQLAPEAPIVQYNLGLALTQSGQLDDAIAAYSRALQLQPGFVEAHQNRGAILFGRNQCEEAVADYRAALQFQPQSPGLLNNLGAALFRLGFLDEAVEAFRAAMERTPDYAEAQSNLIYALHFQPGLDEGKIIEEQHRWNRHIGDLLRRCIQPPANDRSPDRRLRIGYVSPDFRDHVVGRNLRPLFRCHDRRDFEIVVYSGVSLPDLWTEEFREHADRWRSTVGVADERLAEMIRQDGIDILVDLTQHMAGNRLPVFARQPAPVQVSFAGYPASTGVEAIGHRISDRYLERDTDKVNLRPSSPCGPSRPPERICLLDSFWCYDPCGVALPVGASPGPASGKITFGCLNSIAKINPPLLELWARILRQVEDSRLWLLGSEGSPRPRIRELLEQAGVAAGRVEFFEQRPRTAYLELYQQVDIVLDPFPYAGHTTSLDALWMGVPVVSLVGEHSVARAGYSQLSNIGLPELGAFSEEEYVAIATALAHDRPRLAELRRTLRPRLEASLLMDAPRFARKIEAAYRTMWREWCAAGPHPASSE